MEDNAGVPEKRVSLLQGTIDVQHHWQDPLRSLALHNARTQDLGRSYVWLGKSLTGGVNDTQIPQRHGLWATTTTLRRHLKGRLFSRFCSIVNGSQLVISCGFVELQGLIWGAFWWEVPQMSVALATPKCEKNE